MDCLVVYSDNLEDARIVAMQDPRFRDTFSDWFLTSEPAEILDLENPVHHCFYYE